MRRAIGDLGLPPHHFAGRSFQMGAAMVAAQAGLEDSIIMTLGQWNSEAYLQYIRTLKKSLQHSTDTEAQGGTLTSEIANNLNAKLCQLFGTKQFDCTIVHVSDRPAPEGHKWLGENGNGMEEAGRARVHKCKNGETPNKEINGIKQHGRA